MSVDKRVPARSDDEIRRIAERTKADFGLSRRRPVNILKCLESGSVLTLYGRKELVFSVVDDSELAEAYAKAEFSKGSVTITAQRSVRDRAKLGVSRDRMTLAHELGHAVAAPQRANASSGRSDRHDRIVQGRRAYVRPNTKRKSSHPHF